MKHLVWVLLIFVGIAHTSAQDVYTSSGKTGYHKKKKKKGYDPAKVVIGGGLTGGTFGGGYVEAGISGILGYRITDHFSAGIGLGYLYAQSPDFVPPTTYIFRENLIYPSLWTRYFFTRNWFATVAYEYDIISESGPGYDANANLVTIKQWETNSCLFVGGGYKAPLGGRAYWFVEALHDILQGPNSPYAPGLLTVLHIGVGVGL